MAPNFSPAFEALVLAFQRRDWPRTLELSAALLPHWPTHVELHFIAGAACIETRRIGQGVELLARAAAMSPERADIAVRLAQALTMAKRRSEALAAANRALRLAAGNPAMMITLGGLFIELDAYPSAVAALRRAIELSPARANTRYNLATALIGVGDIDAAEGEIEACLLLDPRHWRAHLTLAHLRSQTVASNHVERLQALLDSDPGEEGQIALMLALAKELEDLKDYSSAFDYLTRSKAIARGKNHYSIEQDKAIFAAMERAFPVMRPSSRGSISREPIFVFGMPRTGTTLVERILTSHPDVQGVGELQTFGMALRQAWGSHAPIWLEPDIAGRTQRLDWARVGDMYVASSRPTGDNARFVDKFPFNFLYAGFIANALPNAKMICLRRHPLDACLGSFRQYFGEKLPYYNYSFDLHDTGRYYILFDRLMAHWRRVLPGRILELDYEDLVQSQHACTRKLLEFCELPWDDACLRFDMNPAPVATASALQVRAPIYKDALYRWKKFEPQLLQLRQLLGDAGIDTF